MDRISVVSSNLRSVGYDPDNSILEVEFTNGQIYHYQGVPQDAYQQLMGAGSKGTFFNANIRNAFPFYKA